MRIGQRRHSIVIEYQAAPTRSESGAVVRVDPNAGWQAFATLHAGIVRVRGGEGSSPASFTPIGLYKFDMRYVADVTTAMRIRFGSRTYAIQDVEDVDERGRELIITAQEGLSHGN